MIVGGACRDWISGGAGNDTLTGGAGEERFVYDRTNWGADHITDFTDGVDMIKMKGSGLSFEDLSISQNGGNAMISYLAPGETNVIVLDGVDSDLIDASDFMF